MRNIVLIILSVFIVTGFVGLGFGLIQNNATSIASDISSAPTPTTNPKPTWHTVYTFSAGNGQTATEDFTVRGKKWRLDYQTFNDTGTLGITGFGNGNIGEIVVSGISNNSMPGWNACFPNLCPPDNSEMYSLNINSSDQNYSLQVEDFY